MKKAYQVGVYYFSEDKNLNNIIKHFYDKIKNGENIITVHNQVRNMLGESRLISICKHKEKDIYVVRVFDAVSNGKNILKPRRDESELYIEIEEE